MDQDSLPTRREAKQAFKKQQAAQLMRELSRAINLAIEDGLTTCTVPLLKTPPQLVLTRLTTLGYDVTVVETPLEPRNKFQLTVDFS